MTGMTPPVFTFSGMCVLDPPYIRRPTTRLAYWTVTRRWPRSTKMIAPTTRIISTIRISTWIEPELAEAHLLDGRQHRVREVDDDPRDR